MKANVLKYSFHLHNNGDRNEMNQLTCCCKHSFYGTEPCLLAAVVGLTSIFLVSPYVSSACFYEMNVSARLVHGDLSVSLLLFFSFFATNFVYVEI